MSGLDTILGLARAEARLTRRLVRYWVFQVLALLVGLLGFVYYFWLHYAFSSYSATAAMLNPRYLVGFLGVYYLVGFLLGLVFLGYDIRARDQRERMSEVLDSRPFSNLELLLGKYLGILVSCWVPVVVICLVLLLLGLALGSFVEPRSLLTFAVVMAIPAYAFVLGLVFLVSLVLRHRLLAAIVLVAAIVGLIMINFRYVPIYLLPLVDITGGFQIPAPSDLTPAILDSRSLIQRVGYLLAGLGMVWVAAAIHPRKDGSSRLARAGIGVALIAVGVGACVGLVLDARSTIAKREQWKAAHAAKSEAPRPDLLKLSGNVDLRPPGKLASRFELIFRAPNEAALETAVFTINPGIRVISAEVDGSAVTPKHENGLLEVPLAPALEPGGTATLTLELAGVPDPFFCYLDATIDPLTLSIQDGSMFILGFLSTIYDRRHVALLPGAQWLPASGTAVAPHNRGRAREDFFEVDLGVELPQGWLAAGPGRRRDEGSAGGRPRFRFAPPAPVPEVALIAGPYESRSTDIEGVTLEILMHPKHAESLDFFADATAEIRGWLAENLREAAEAGLVYPYDALTMVEVNGTLRGYGGGWRMDSTLHQPTMILVRESGFPTARFDVPFKKAERFRDQEGGIPRAKRDVLLRFFENDFSGGNPFIGASRSFFSYLTSGIGPEGLPLDFVYEDLSTRLVTERQGYFSIYHYGKDLNQTVGNTITAVFRDQSSVSDALIDAVTSRSEVWDTVTETSLAELDPWKAPKRAIDVLTLKGGAMSRSLLDGLGRDKMGHLLAHLRENTAGRSYDREDVLAAGEAVDEDLSTWLDVWIDQTDLPGFTAERVSLQRISDSEEGNARYQLLVTVVNHESTPGLVRLEHITGGSRPGSADTDGDAPREVGEAEPVRIPAHSAIEIGVVLSEIPHTVRVAPYLSLNRTAFGVTVPTVNQEKIVDAEPFVGERPVAWQAVDDGSIVVDDLDDGFSIDEGDGRDGLRVAGRGSQDEDTDGGLPVAGPGNSLTRWSRRATPSAYGKYRHTLALIRKGKGKRKAVFTAELPTAGEWELEYHVPSQTGRRNRGKWSLNIVDDSGTTPITFDADGAESGWNLLGAFEVSDGEVRVEVSDESDGGRTVLADAIRWVPSGGASTAASAMGQ